MVPFFVKGITIQALGDLKDYESLEFIFIEFKTQQDKYIREIAVESIIKLEPKILLPYKEDDFVYGELCRYVVESGEILREQEIIIDEGCEMENKKDVFISYASEDKKNIVKPLVQILEANGISCWYDEQDIEWGDNIVEKINNGLAKSKYFLVVLSETYLSKNWAMTELNTLMNIEASTREKRVLPLIIGNANEMRNLLQKLYPLLHPKSYLEWNDNPINVAEELKRILGKSKNIQYISNNFSDTSMSLSD